MEEFIREHGLQSRVRLHGSHTAMEREYPKHAILLFPSRCEGFGLVQIEAMSCGLPSSPQTSPSAGNSYGTAERGAYSPPGTAAPCAEPMHAMAGEDLAPYARKARAQEQFFTLERIIREWNGMLKEVNP